MLLNSGTLMAVLVASCSDSAISRPILRARPWYWEFGTDLALLREVSRIYRQGIPQREGTFKVYINYDRGLLSNNYSSKIGRDETWFWFFGSRYIVINHLTHLPIT